MADVYEHQRMFAEAFAARQQALSMQQDPTVTALAEAYGHSGYRGWLLKKIEILEQAPPLAKALPECRHSSVRSCENYRLSMSGGSWPAVASRCPMVSILGVGRVLTLMGRSRRPKAVGPKAISGQSRSPIAQYL
jgi:hypothetical protein